MSVLVETTIGDLVFDLYTEERPKSCLNFLKLCKIKYYNFALFHSVRRNFIAQSGDPTGSGRGGESVFSFVYGDQAKYFDLELKPRIKHRTKGTISFVNNGNDMHGSQFFITLGDGLDFLDGKHTVFGQLAEGFDTLEKLNETICDESHKPYRDVRISHTLVLDDPFDDPKGLVIPDRSPEPTKEQLESGRIGADEDIDNEGKSKEEIQKELDDKELKIGTKILETVGDIDSADLKPPENVLFVCKLNPVTNAEDLKIIFSRFGKISSCEIITDHKTGDSLCYGFVEFKEVESCEKAYFKMDNVLIDDRRIHVDFCQSVAKLKKWHNSSAFKKSMAEQQTPKRIGYELKDKSKKAEDSYEMVFDDDHTASAKKKNKEENLDRRRSNKKKNRDDDDEDDEGRDEIRKKDKKMQSVGSRKRSRSYSSSSEDEVSKERAKKKRNDLKDSESRSKKKDRKYSESEKSSEEEYRKRNKKDTTTNERHSAKKNNKKVRKHDDSNSESEYETRTTNRNKKNTKSSKYSDSDSDDRDVSRKKSRKNKRDDRRRYSSSDDGDRRRSRGRKSEKSVSTKRYEDSDTEEYTEDEPRSKKSKKGRYSSDESSDEKHRSTKRRSNVSSKRRSNISPKRRSDSYDERRRSSTKNSSSSRRKSYKRKEGSDYSDSSD